MKEWANRITSEKQTCLYGPETMYDLHVEKKQHELEIVEGVQVRLSQKRYSHPRQQRHIPGKVGEE